MRSHWISVAGCLALVAGQSAIYGQGDPTPAAPAAVVPIRAAVELQPLPDVAQSSGLGFRKVTSTGGFADAERTMVRVVAGGRIVQTKRVGIGGVAQISDVAAGAYSVFANGNEGIAAYGIYLGDEAHAVSNRVGLVPLRDAATVMNLIRTHSQGGPGGAADAGAADDAGSLAENGDFEVDADGSVKGQAVLPAPAGQPRAPLANHYVAFVRGGQVVAETHTDANGNFALTGVSSGIYSVAFAGPSGFGAYSTGVRQPDAHVQARVTRLQFVALLAGGGGGTVVPASPRDFGLFIQTAGAPSGTNPAQSAMGPGPGGFGGGGSGGGSGGGGGGGGGLLGALAGAGIGAGIGAALANQDNNNNPATPAMP